MAPSVGLGSTEDKLRKDDLLGALICSMAAYMRNAEAECLFRKAQEVYPSPRFSKVHMSVDPSMAKKQRRGQKFLVAYTADCVFIAFRGTKNLKDVASDLCTNSERRFGGTFHKGFYDRADSFLGSDKWNPLPDLLDTARRESRRIIFCGHSLGGAVAHMVLFRFLLQPQFDTEQMTCENYQDSMISVAFGAPHVCDDKAARLINEDSRFKWRFINFVNQNDPVPHMLHDLKKTTVDVLRGLLEEADKILKRLGGFASRCVEGFDNSGARGLVETVGKEMAHSAARSLTVGAKKLTHILHDNFLREADAPDLTEDPVTPDFFPVGQYLCIKWEGGRWHYQHYPSGSDRITEFFLEKVEYSHANVRQHLLNSYRGALVETGFIDSPTRTGETASPVNPDDPCLVTTPTPKVWIARWKAEEQDSDQRFVTVEGENLLFLREAVSISGSNGQEDWEIGKQSDKLLLIYDPKDSSTKHKHCEDAVSMVIIKTAFGEISHPVVQAEDYPSKERMLIGAQRMLKMIAESLMVKATPPLSIRPDSDADVMASLDDIMHCVPSLKEKMVSRKLTEITKFTHTDGGEFLDRIKDINYMFKQVISCSNSCLRVEYKSSGLMKRFLRFRQNNPNWVIPAAVAGILVLPITLGAVLGVLIFYEKKSIIDGYELVLQKAIDEASEWSTATGLQDNGGTSGVRNSSSRDYLETLLNQTVSGSCSEFKDMVKKAHLLQPKDVKDFRSGYFLNATAKSRIKLLKRIKVVCDSISLYTKVVLDTHYIGVFGEEDSGKSTFIQRVLKKFRTRFHHSKLPAVGMDVHTKTAVPYRLNETLWLVDFPGSNGVDSYASMWKQFTALSSSAILFLPFVGDVKREQVDMYKDLRDNLGAETEVTVVFNKVDLMFTPKKKATLTGDYFEKQRAKTRRKFECEERDAVHFSCVEPDPPESLEELQKVGVLGFEEIMRAVKPDWKACGT